ncbi:MULTISPECIES: HTH domain-containing protein [Lactiplantibacillus]|uniref:HTH domain-containing protein n=1 Tax=Lactiplantibacillus TaxID=2767842 RepID=UPI001C1FDC9E|nr:MULTISPECIES: HTH domain-containing protein [Lactiplantibacillus]MBU7505000.1 HTH domain-containing protein [Lactiplantibacillus pentosus]MCT4443938.1 HTH domain-containing protein [Lactiplantibacillus argentoratensis]
MSNDRTITMSQIAESLDVSKSTVRNTVHKLTDDNLVDVVTGKRGARLFTQSEFDLITKEINPVKAPEVTSKTLTDDLAVNALINELKLKIERIALLERKIDEQSTQLLQIEQQKSHGFWWRLFH